MPDTAQDPELNAIQEIIKTLEPLNADARQRVIAYVFQRLGFAFEPQIAPASRAELSRSASTDLDSVKEESPAVIDIRTLKEQKSPSTDSEMAAVVAYYLSEIAPSDLRKETLSKRDIDNYFKQAKYPLPKESKFTLPNGAKAGYLDALGNGQYRLNPIGFNLVVHGLPAKRISKRLR